MQKIFIYIQKRITLLLFKPLKIGFKERIMGYTLKIERYQNIVYKVNFKILKILIEAILSHRN